MILWRPYIPIGLKMLKKWKKVKNSIPVENVKEKYLFKFEN